MARILVVDDSQAEVDKISSILKANGYDVVSATSGEEGVAVAKREKPDVVLMDIVMPGVNGFQATRNQKRQYDGRYSCCNRYNQKTRDRQHLGRASGRSSVSRQAC